MCFPPWGVTSAVSVHTDAQASLIRKDSLRRRNEFAEIRHAPTPIAQLTMNREAILLDIFRPASSLEHSATCRPPGSPLTPTPGPVMVTVAARKPELLQAGCSSSNTSGQSRE